MLFRSPSSLPISASVVAVKPLRAKHLAAADRIEATRGFSQSALRADAPFSSLGLRAVTVGCSVVVVVIMGFVHLPASRCQKEQFRRDISPLVPGSGGLRSVGRSSQAKKVGR